MKHWFQELKHLLKKRLKETVLTFDKQQRDENLDTLKAEIATEFVDEADPENELLIDEVYAILNDLVKEEVRRLIADEKLDLMGVNQMKLDHLNLKLVYCHEHMAQVYLHVDKLKLYLY